MLARPRLAARRPIGAKQTAPPATPQDIEAACKSLKSLKLPGMKSIEMHRELSGKFHFESEHRDITGLPPFCRVQARLEPVSQSAILIELWLSKDHWNGRFLGTGNGGAAGHIAYGALASGLKKGFAVVNTDMGTAPDANKILDAPPKSEEEICRSHHAEERRSERLGSGTMYAPTLE